ncbi:MAG: hypothetical protein R2792_12930 [Saprospiraceae bacterium]
MKKLSWIIGSSMLVALAFTACNKNTDSDKEAMTTTSEDIATSQDFSEEIDLDADMIIEERGGGGGGLCPAVSFAQPYGTWPNSITIDFGDGCEYPENSGRILTGIIHIEQSAARFTPGAVRTKTFEDFTIDDVQVEGTKTWTNNGQDAAGLWSFTKTAEMTLTYPDGASGNWTHNHTSTLIEGGETITHFDNVWSTTGYTEGTNRNGVAYSATIAEPLIKKAFCRWISAGVIDFTRDDRNASLDFGDGTCDRFGQLTLDNGDTITIRLRH